MRNAVLEPSRGCLGAVLGWLWGGGSWGGFGPVLGGLRAVFRRSWGVFGRSWGVLVGLVESWGCVIVLGTFGNTFPISDFVESHSKMIFLLVLFLVLTFAPTLAAVLILVLW